jgi:phosphoribosyl-ATP pyrophosphohydrolase
MMNQHVPPATIERLAQLIRERARSGDENSYTRKLLEKGLPKVCKKLGEEATEVVVAALAQDRTALVGEIADLVYHLLVLMEAAEIDIAEVGAVLEGRMGRSGLDEKASRKQP